VVNKDTMSLALMSSSVDANLTHHDITGGTINVEFYGRDELEKSQGIFELFQCAFEAMMAFIELVEVLLGIFRKIMKEFWIRTI
jgi:hypothetical protein